MRGSAPVRNCDPGPDGLWITPVVRLCLITGVHKICDLKTNLDRTPENKKRKVLVRSGRNITNVPHENSLDHPFGAPDGKWRKHQ